MTNEKLKPCPFCGGEAHATPAHGPTRMAERVACLVCAAELSGTGAIEQWQARAALPVREAVADGWQLARDRYTCTGKGGEYELLGLAQGAGTLKGLNHMVYRNVDGVMFVREPEDFLSRMEKITAPSPSCAHEWVDARNEIVKSGEICAKCYALRAGNEASPSREGEWPCAST